MEVFLTRDMRTVDVDHLANHLEIINNYQAKRYCQDQGHISCFQISVINKKEYDSSKEK